MASTAPHEGRLSFLSQLRINDLAKQFRDGWQTVLYLLILSVPRPNTNWPASALTVNGVVSAVSLPWSSELSAFGMTLAQISSSVTRHKVKINIRWVNNGISS